METPYLPLKFRRKSVGVDDMEHPHWDLLAAGHKSPTSFASISGSSARTVAIPSSPDLSFSLSSSPIPASSSPVCSVSTRMFTPDLPPSSPISSSPRSFWHVALNDGPGHPRRIGFKPYQNAMQSSSPTDSTFSRDDNHDFFPVIPTRRRSSSESAPTLVSDIDPSEYSDDIDMMDEYGGTGDDPFADANAGRMIQMGYPDPAINFPLEATSQLYAKQRGAQVDKTIGSCNNDFDIAAALLDLRRQVRILTKPLPEGGADTTAVKVEENTSPESLPGIALLQESSSSSQEDTVSQDPPVPEDEHPADVGKEIAMLSRHEVEMHNEVHLPVSSLCNAHDGEVFEEDAKLIPIAIDTPPPANGDNGELASAELAVSELFRYTSNSEQTPEDGELAPIPLQATTAIHMEASSGNTVSGTTDTSLYQTADISTASSTQGSQHHDLAIFDAPIVSNGDQFPEHSASFDIERSVVDAPIPLCPEASSVLHGWGSCPDDTNALSPGLPQAKSLLSPRALSGAPSETFLGVELRSLEIVEIGAKEQSSIPLKDIALPDKDLTDVCHVATILRDRDDVPDVDMQQKTRKGDTQEGKETDTLTKEQGSQKRCRRRVLKESSKLNAALIQPAPWESGSDLSSLSADEDVRALERKPLKKKRRREKRVEPVKETSTDIKLPTNHDDTTAVSLTFTTPETHDSSSKFDAEILAEMRGFLMQAMALSRASSMPASSLLREVLREQPQLGSIRSRDDSLSLIEVTLAKGSDSNVFGRIDRDGKDAADRPLEAQWFYIPENDEDQERAALLREMMPKKRSATKKHKQYYYRPLPKISRWDAEDDV